MVEPCAGPSPFPAWCTGETVCFLNEATGVRFTALIERRPAPPRSKNGGTGWPQSLSAVALGRDLLRPYDRLCRARCRGSPSVGTKVDVSWAGYGDVGSGRDAVWEVLLVAEQGDNTNVLLTGGGFFLAAVAHVDVAPLEAVVVDPCRPARSAVWAASAVADPLSCGVSHERVVRAGVADDAFLSSDAVSPSSVRPDDAFPLCLVEADMRRFIRDGVLVVRQGACAAACAAAKAFLNIRLGNPEEALVPGRVGKFVGGLSNAQPLLEVCRRPPLARLVEQLIGVGQVAEVVTCQPALRFPRCMDDLTEAGAAARGPRVTGRDWHTDGLRQGRKHPFSLLVGVALSDVTAADTGNLCVWREGHLKSHSLMRWPGGEVQRCVTSTGDDGGLPDLGPCEQLRLFAGDVVLGHSSLPHCGAPHCGADIRYMLYFRLRHVRLDEMIAEELFEHDMWCDLTGLHPFLT